MHVVTRSVRVLRVSYLGLAHALSACKAAVYESGSHKHGRCPYQVNVIDYTFDVFETCLRL